MKKKLITLFGIAALTLVPAVYSAAQPVDGPGDEEMMGEPGGPGGPTQREIMIKQRGPAGRDEEPGRRAPGFGKKGGFNIEEDEILPLIKKYDPALAAKLAELKTTAAPKYKMILMMAGRALGPALMGKDESLAKDAVQAVSLEYDTKELSVKYDKAADTEKAAIKADLKVKTAELFDLKLKGQEFRVKMMEKDLAKLKKNIETRRAGKAKIVDERVGQLTGESVGW